MTKNILGNRYWRVTHRIYLKKMFQFPAKMNKLPMYCKISMGLMGCDQCTVNVPECHVNHVSW